MPAAIYSLAFSPSSAHQPPLLLASTAHGSLHLFRLGEASRRVPQCRCGRHTLDAARLRRLPLFRL